MFENTRRMLDAAKARRPECSRVALLLAEPGLQALILQRAAYWCTLQGWSGAALAAAWFNRWLTGLSAAPDVKLGFDVFLPAPTGVVIGEGVVVGDHVVIGPGAMILASASGAPQVGDGAHIGADARIVGNVCIAPGEQVSAGAVVTEVRDADAANSGLPKAVKKQEADPTSAKSEVDPAVKELVRVVREQNAVIAKLNAAIAGLGGEAVPAEQLPKISGKAAGISTRRARHHRTKKPTTDASSS